MSPYYGEYIDLHSKKSMNGTDPKFYHEDMKQIWEKIDEIRKFSEDKISWLTFWSITTFFGLIIIGFFYYQFSQQSAIAKDLKEHEQTQVASEKSDIAWKASIDSRLSNIEKAVGAKK